jgi:hypothetical protein
MMQREESETPPGWLRWGISMVGGGSDVRLGDGPSGDALRRARTVRHPGGKVNQGGGNALVS